MTLRTRCLSQSLLGVLLGVAVLLGTAPAQAQQAAAPAAAVTPSGPDQADAALSNPYAATVPVADSSEAARAEALRKALQVVLTTVSGGMPGGSGTLRTAESLLRYYGYVRDSVSGALMLQAEFDRRAVNQLLRDAGMPIFGVRASPASDFELLIDGVASSADYAAILRYLQAQSGVRSLQIRAVADDGIQLSLSAEGGESAFSEAALSGGVLRPLAPGHYALVGRP